jgi:transposase-like protein
MPWKKTSPMKQREEFVLKALQPQVNFSELCREYGVSRKTGYKWVKRFRERGLRGLEELAHGPAPGRRPLRCSADAVVELLNLELIQFCGHFSAFAERRVHAQESSPVPP